MSDNNDYTSYGFMYRDCGGKVSKHEVKLDEVTWPEVLDDFVNFLENIYGYDIKDSILIKEPLFPINPKVWKGGYFDDAGPDHENPWGDEE